MSATLFFQLDPKDVCVNIEVLENRDVEEKILKEEIISLRGSIGNYQINHFPRFFDILSKNKLTYQDQLLEFSKVSKLIDYFIEENIELNKVFVLLTNPRQAFKNTYESYFPKSTACTFKWLKSYLLDRYGSKMLVDKIILRGGYDNPSTIFKTLEPILKKNKYRANREDQVFILGSGQFCTIDQVLTQILFHKFDQLTHLILRSDGKIKDSNFPAVLKESNDFHWIKSYLEEYRYDSIYVLLKSYDLSESNLNKYIDLARCLKNIDIERTEEIFHELGFSESTDEEYEEELFVDYEEDVEENFPLETELLQGFYSLFKDFYPKKFSSKKKLLYLSFKIKFFQGEYNEFLIQVFTFAEKFILDYIDRFIKQETGIDLINDNWEIIRPAWRNYRDPKKAYSSSELNKGLINLGQKRLSYNSRKTPMAIYKFLREIKPEEFSLQVDDKTDQILLALFELLDPLSKVRNEVAHNILSLRSNYKIEAALRDGIGRIKIFNEKSPYDYHSLLAEAKSQKLTDTCTSKAFQMLAETFQNGESKCPNCHIFFALLDTHFEIEGFGIFDRINQLILTHMNQPQYS